MCHRCNESTNQWINESVIQGINESINKRVTESVNQEWTKEWLNWRKEGGMDEWMDEWVAFLCGLLLHWATSFFSYFFSEQPLIWATSSFTCLPASSSVASATHFFSSCSCYNAFSNQLQSRLAGASQHHWCFPARSRVNALCHSRLQTMGTRRHKSGAAPNVQFFSILIRAHSLSLSTFWWPNLLKVPRVCQLLTVFMWNQALATVLCTYIEACTCRNRGPTSATPQATKNNGVLRPTVFFTREFKRSRSLTLPNYLMMGGWHDDLVDMIVGILAMTIIRNSEVLRLNFLW